VYATYFVILLSFHFCTSDNSTNPPAQAIKDYYPGSEGTNYKYEVEQKDSTGIIESGIRFVIYGNEMYIDSVLYRIQDDSTDGGTSTAINVSYFRKTSTGVFYYVDTSQVLGIVPDSLKSLISIQNEMRILLNPLAIGSFWPVYRITVNLASGISFSPINVNGYFVNQENLTLNLETGTTEVSTDKVKYDLEIKTDINQPVQTFSAYAWFADEIGLVKMEGSSIVINILLTGEINFVGTTTSGTQHLINYEIK
jgi:hypothetical protein